MFHHVLSAVVGLRWGPAEWEESDSTTTDKFFVSFQSFLVLKKSRRTFMFLQRPDDVLPKRRAISMSTKVNSTTGFSGSVFESQQEIITKTQIFPQFVSFLLKPTTHKRVSQEKRH